ncbi:MAG: Fic family protein [Campylobacterota bacterium]|nr:Fic family protein [Campylobacterota bacterium]
MKPLDTITKNSKAYKGLTTYKKTALKERLKAEWVYTSNAIEGNTVSLGDTAFIIEEGLTVSGVTLKEHEEVVGHARAIDIVYELLEKDTLCEEDIFKLHKAVQTSLVIDIDCPLGAYKVEVNGRYVNVDGVREHKYYPHPDDVKHLMALWFEEFRDISKKEISLQESIKRYTRSHIGFTSIHPFFDGNGRLARLLANITMLKNGYLPLIIDNKKREKYIKLLSSYNLHSSELTSQSDAIIEENSYFEAIYEFFISQYQNSQALLDEIK